MLHFLFLSAAASFATTTTTTTFIYTTKTVLHILILSGSYLKISYIVEAGLRGFMVMHMSQKLASACGSVDLEGYL